jgi:MOSC domain
VGVTAPAGTVVSLHLAPTAGAPMETVAEVRALPGRGLEGDRYFLGTGVYSAKASFGGREVTLIELEAIEALLDGVVNAAGHRLGIKLAPGAARRNIVTAGVALNHLVDREFTVGPVRMVGTRLCEPCKYLESLTEAGVMGGLVHRGGVRARILSEGIIRTGDVVRASAR